ncbi:MAG: FAD-dependent thymidylate synthase [Rhizomicrobium sp.]
MTILARPTLTEGIENWIAAKGFCWIEDAPGMPAERLVEFSGRICYMSFYSKNSKQYRTTNRSFIENLIVQGHESVFEHVAWTVLLDGVSRAFTHQMVRHRIGFSFSQLSQQYHDESEVSFVEPPGLVRSLEALTAWHEATEAARKAYAIIKAKFPEDPVLSSERETNRRVRSASRSVLPNAAISTIVVTANARAIRHFLRLRGANEGDSEMRAVSTLFYEMLKIEAPGLVADFECRPGNDGSPIIVVCPLKHEPPKETGSS